jgi:hypothetical protein
MTREEITIRHNEIRSFLISEGIDIRKFTILGLVDDSFMVVTWPEYDIYMTQQAKDKLSLSGITYEVRQKYN